MFCYICGEFTVKRQRLEIDDLVQMAYLAYFRLKLGDQDKSWAPHMVCKTCKERLRFWTNGERGDLPFAGLVRTSDNQISRQYLRIDTIFPEYQLKKDISFPDRLVERSIIFQTTETIKHPFSHGTFQSHGYGFTSHLFHVVVKNRAK